jgi:zinc transporter ZupT
MLHIKCYFCASITHNHTLSTNMTLSEYLTLFFTVLIGGGFGFYLQRKRFESLQLVLSFSGAFLLGISLLHLMPTVYVQQKEQAGLWILLGFFIQLFLEQLSTGVEHGHVHAAEKGTRGFALQIMLGLCLHAFMEGMPLSGYAGIHELQHAGHSHNHHHLLYGIILHKAPAAFALVMVLLGSGIKPARVLAYLFIFAAMTPAGALLTQLTQLSADNFSVLLAMVIGSFLHIATTILFESGGTRAHRVPIKKILAILLGVGLALLTMLG